MTAAEYVFISCRRAALVRSRALIVGLLREQAGVHKGAPVVCGLIGVVSDRDGLVFVVGVGIGIFVGDGDDRGGFLHHCSGVERGVSAGESVSSVTRRT